MEKTIIDWGKTVTSQEGSLILKHFRSNYNYFRQKKNGGK